MPIAASVQIPLIRPSVGLIRQTAPFLFPYLQSIVKVCERHAVERLYAFGSVCEPGRFRSDSDVDFIVKFKKNAPAKGWYGEVSDLQADFARLLGRNVDLIEEKPIGNPYLKRAVDRQKLLLYGTAMEDRVKKRLWDVRQAIADAEAFVSEVNDGFEYANNRLVKSAVERQLTIIGEAMAAIRQSGVAFEGITAMHEIVAFRNLLVHVYDKVDDIKVWKIVRDQLPLLKAEVNALLEAD